MESLILEKNNNNPKFSAVYNDSYNDEFDKHRVSKEYSRVISPKHQPHVSDDEQVIISSATSPAQIGQHRLDRPENDHSLDKPSDTDSEPETDTYHFTDDQQRAMMELMVQKQEAADLLDEEPPEYNVKGRLEQLNAELAKDPTPVDESREHRVGFKAQIVDLVAPPPVDFSDDESQPNSVSSALLIATALAFPKEEGGSNNDRDKKDDDKKKDENKENVVDSNSKEFVVERDGQFALVSASDLSQSERLIFLNENETEKMTEVQSNGGEIKTEIDSNKSHSAGKVKTGNSSPSQVLPRPPLRPRPNTAFSGPRRNVQPLRSQLTRSAVQPSNCNTVLDNFNYNSPYAMTPQQKEEAKEKARILEEEKKEKERKIREEAEEKKRESESAFQAWLCKKREEDRKKQGAEVDKQKSDKERTEDKEEAYKAWLKEKKAQGKKEKLLKRRQQQEKSDGLFYHSSEECDKAFKEWLKKKNAASKKQMAAERQMNRIFKIQVKRSKKIQAIIKALKEAQADQYSDNSGFQY
ncbi:hypothetical protein BsWGS_13101 [Bradybaena similaris]